MLFRRGAAAYGTDDFASAADYFSRAYALSHEPGMLYNLALSQQRAGDVDGAITSYRAFLEAVPDAPERTEVELSLATLERLQASEREREAAPPSPAEVIVAPPRHELSPVPFVVTGLGVAGLAVATAFGVVAADRHDAAVAAPSQAAALGLAHERDDYALAANVMWAVSGTVALAGAIWLVVDVAQASAGPSEPAVTLQVGPGSLAVHGTF